MGKATKCFDQMGILLMGDEIFLYRTWGEAGGGGGGGGGGGDNN